MSQQTIICPKCKNEFEISEALEAQLKDGYKKELAEQYSQKEKEFQKKEDELKTKTAGMQEEIDKRLSAEMLVMKEKAKKEAEGNISTQLKDMENQLAEKNKKIKDAEVAELEFRKQKRDLEEKQKDLELDVARKLDTERKKIEETTKQRVVEEERYKALQKDKTINDLTVRIAELKQKAEQGSQKNQGEVVELDLESILKQVFPIDNIDPVPSGIRGADIVQKVNNQTGRYCGTILWEIKHTKNWSDGWVEKLKNDQRELKAEIPILMTKCLPEGIKNFGQYQGIWVTNFESAVNLTTVLRMNLAQIAGVKAAESGKGDKMELLYRYLSGVEFKQRIEAMVETFITMQEDLDKEKRAIASQWSKREKGIKKVVYHMSGMYGDMQGLIGASLPMIKSLELPE